MYTYCKNIEINTFQPDIDIYFNMQMMMMMMMMMCVCVCVSHIHAQRIYDMIFLFRQLV